MRLAIWTQLYRLKDQTLSNNIAFLWGDGFERSNTWTPLQNGLQTCHSFEFVKPRVRLAGDRVSSYQVRRRGVLRKPAIWARVCGIPSKLRNPGGSDRVSSSHVP
eukprot:177547-Heterocapsa_arctica.AAC.1